MTIKSIVGRALIAGIAISAVTLGSAAAAQALPKNPGDHAGACYDNGVWYPNGSSNPTKTDQICVDGVWTFGPLVNRGAARHSAPGAWYDIVGPAVG
jgi:hypothetical protein